MTLRIVHTTQIRTVNYMQYSIVQVDSVNVINDQILSFRTIVNEVKLGIIHPRSFLIFSTIQLDTLPDNL